MRYTVAYELITAYKKYFPAVSILRATRQPGCGAAPVAMGGGGASASAAPAPGLFKGWSFGS